MNETRTRQEYSPQSRTPLNIMWTVLMRSLGIMLILFCYLLILVIYYSFVFDIVQAYHFHYKNYLISGILLLIGTYLVFNIVFNYTLAILIGTGDTTQFEILSPETLDNSENQRNRNNRNQQIHAQTCQQCAKVKPPRAHHCSVCNKCVLKMDHHCPWINGCVGHQNHRYFMLFIFYLMIGLGWMAVLYFPILFSESYVEYKVARSRIFSIVCTLVYVLFVVLSLFNMWNWFLVFQGKTAIEFWSSKLPSNSDREDHYAFYSLDKFTNLENTFGTRSVCTALLPSTRELPSDGVHWTLYSTQKLNYSPQNGRDDDKDEEVITFTHEA